MGAAMTVTASLASTLALSWMSRLVGDLEELTVDPEDR
jgi:hypothetical protein